ncbi:MAG TPA: citrate (Si)-synthase [Myxococcota bacterium]|nr:citrate (Si)-synthase [Myxococcota bacterium]
MATEAPPGYMSAPFLEAPMADGKKVLFEITEEHLDTGLRGFPVGTVRSSFVDPDDGVHYVGYPVADLAYLDPEAVVYLIFNKRLPTDEELVAFKADLASRAKVDPRVIDLLKGLPKDGHPMEWLMCGLSYLGMTGKTGDWKEDALNMIARSAELVANIFRIRSGWGEPIASNPSLGLVENMVHMMGVPGGDTEKLTKLLRIYYVLHMDHGGGNLSTFTGKAVASGLADQYSALSASMASLYGPLHGRANQECLEFIRKVGTTDGDAVESFVRNELASGGKIFGFGHAVLRKEDPRAKVQYALGEELCPNDPLFRTSVVLRERAVKVLKENPKVSNPYPNVDAVSGALVNACGLTDPEFYTVLFGFSRIAGIAAQIVDERTVARNGKGVPIYRCKYIAVNQPRQRLNNAAS